MPAPSRPRHDATDDWQQLDLLVQFPEQRTCELIRPVVLFGLSPAERACQTGTPARTLSRQAARFAHEGMASLFASPRPAPKEPHFFLDPAIRDAILSLKAEHAALNTHELTTICWIRFGHRPSARTCGRIMALNRKLYGLGRPARTPREPKVMPYGIPETLVSDSGAVFVTAKQAKAVYAALGIEKREIERRQPWQNSIKTCFNVQRRMANWDFAKATTWAKLLAVHDQWVVDYNYQRHWAHQQRADDRRSPRDVLGWVSGREIAPEELHRIFYRTRFGRVLDKLGYVRFRHWRVYGERGLAGDHAAVWLYGETLTIAFADEPLARYRVRYQPDKQQLRTVEEPYLFETPYRAAQLPLWEWNETEWLKMLPVAPYTTRRRRSAGPEQQPLFTDILPREASG